LETIERLLYGIFNSKTNKNNKTITVRVSYWRQLNGCFKVFSIAKQAKITRQEQFECHIGEN